MKAQVKSFFHERSSTFSHVVSDPETGEAAVVDPVLDFDPRSGRTDTRPADLVVSHVREAGLEVDWILETHAHADHLSGAAAVREAVGGTLAIGEGIRGVQARFGKLFGLGESFASDGSQFDHLFSDGDRFRLGGLEARVLHTPGHTGDSVTYVIGDAAFIGDTLFAPDYGTARCDFPGGDAAELYRSIGKLLVLPPGTRLFLCHDYPTSDRAPNPVTSIDEQRRNVHLVGMSQADFIAMRTERDRELDVPDLLLPSLQVNIRAGELPAPEANGIRYLKLPIDQL